MRRIARLFTRPISDYDWRAIGRNLWWTVAEYRLRKARLYIGVVGINLVALVAIIGAVICGSVLFLFWCLITKTDRQIYYYRELAQEQHDELQRMDRKD